MREHDGAEHHLFGELLGLGFDHHHRVMGAGDDEVELTFAHLVHARVELIFAVLVADPRGGDRAHEGDAGNGQRRGGGDHRQDVALGLAVIGEHLSNHVDLVIEPLRKQRPDRPIDEAARESLFLGGAALALEKAARDAPGGREFFLIVDGQREEVLAFLDALRGGDRAEDDGFAIGREHRAVGLAGNAARFESERLAAPLDFNFLHVEHWIFPSTPAAICRGGL